jgi:hypothetical protein
VLTYSRWLISFFGIPFHGTAAYAMHLGTGFFISGLFHVITLCCTGGGPTIGQKFAKIMFFFMMQPVGIFFEQWTKSAFNSKDNLTKSKEADNQVNASKSEAGSITRRSLLEKTVWNVIGYVWVLTFLFVTGWPFLDIYFQLGMADWDVPYSFVGLLMKTLGYSRN